MGLVKTRRLAAMHPPSPRLRRTGKQQRAILLRQGFHLRRGYGGRDGGLKAGLKSHPPKVTPPPRQADLMPNKKRGMHVFSYSVES